MSQVPMLYVVRHFGDPVRVRPEFGETQPWHADMLRYDLAFHNPGDPAEVVFPIFSSRKEGRTTSRITFARWRSYCMTVQAQDVTDRPLGDWIGYQPHATRLGVLVPISLNDYLKLNPQLKITGWR